MYYFDSTFTLVIIAMVISLLASIYVKATFKKYSKIPVSTGLTGVDTARRILCKEGLNNVQIFRVRGSLTDHYDPRNRSVSLSDPVCNVSSISAVSVAAHECGHAQQHGNGYIPLLIRKALVPVTSICSVAAWPIVIIGLFIGATPFIQLGIYAYTAVVGFHLITLPVEFNASKRGLRSIENCGILNSEEMKGARRVLRAAALTYVASALASVLSLLRLVMIANRRR